MIEKQIVTSLTICALWIARRETMKAQACEEEAPNNMRDPSRVI